MTWQNTICYIQKKDLADFFATTVRPHAPERNYSPFQPVRALSSLSLSLSTRARKKQHFSLYKSSFRCGGLYAFSPNLLEQDDYTYTCTHILHRRVCLIGSLGFQLRVNPKLNDPNWDRIENLTILRLWWLLTKLLDGSISIPLLLRSCCGFCRKP